MHHDTFQKIGQSPFTDHFSNLKDPRRSDKGNFKHHLSDIFLLTISSMLCGANDWDAVVEFGNDEMQ